MAQCGERRGCIEENQVSCAAVSKLVYKAAHSSFSSMNEYLAIYSGGGGYF